jgi:hypothetical protein
VKINLDGIRLLGEILEKDNFEEKEFYQLMRTKAMKGFIEHEKNFNKKVNKIIIKEEVINTIKVRGYKDKFEFHIIKENIGQLKEDLNYIENNEYIIVNEALKRVYNIVPKHTKINPNIYLYGGGIDGGFTIYRKKIYINYIKYIGDKEEFIKVLSHELFHCRKLPLKSKSKTFFIYDFNLEKFMYEIIGKALEEGIASLIQHGHYFKKDDPVGMLTNRNLVLAAEEFNRLNDILMTIKYGRPDYYNIKILNIYVIGYYMVNMLYHHYGKEILLPWIVNYDYKELIKAYIEINRTNNMSSGFSDEIEKWIISL